MVKHAGLNPHNSKNTPAGQAFGKPSAAQPEVLHFRKSSEEPPRRLARNAGLNRYLNRSAMTVWRWKHDPDLDFPKPIVVGKIEYNDLDLVDAWLRTKVAR